MFSVKFHKNSILKVYREYRYSIRYCRILLYFFKVYRKGIL